MRLRQMLEAWLPWVYTVALTLVLTLILSVNLTNPMTLDIQEGDIAQDTIVAPQSKTYVSDFLTEKAREDAATAVPDVYSLPERNIGRTQDGFAREVFDFINVVRGDASASTEQKIATLQAIEGIALDAETATSLLTMSATDFDTVRRQVSTIIGRLMSSEIRNDGTYDIAGRVSRELGFGLNEAQEAAVINLATQFVIPNSFFRPEETEQLRQETRDKVESVTSIIVQGENIVAAGQEVNLEHIEALEQLGLLQSSTNWVVTGRIALVTFLCVTICMLYWRQFNLPRYHGRRYIILLSILAVFFVLLARFVLAQPQIFVQLLFPAVALGMLVAVIFDVRFAAIIIVALGGIGGYIAGNSLETAFYIIVGSLMAIFSLRRIERINGIFRAGIIAGVGNILVVIAFNLTPLVDLFDFTVLLGLALTNGLLAASLTIAGFYLIGNVLGIITTLQLQELSHLDHPLLKELLRRAPGTYHHSIMVSNLAEQAAERIRANASLVRVGAFYHDIGKMTRPPFFTENQEGINPHDQLDPYSSARIIISHVTDGLKMAQQYRLPQQVQEFIATHHGNRVLKGFYKKACALEADPDSVDIDRFRYPGPLPTSRETGLVAMADTLEAASSAIQPNNEAAVEKLVNTLIDEILQEGQLDQSGLSLGDIKAARESFMDTMKGRFHIRVRYEGNESIAAQNTQAVIAPPSHRVTEMEALPSRLELPTVVRDSAEMSPSDSSIAATQSQ